MLYKSKVINSVDNIPVYDVCLLLHGEHSYSLTSVSSWFGRSYYCMECKKNIQRQESAYTCSMCKENTFMYKPLYKGSVKKCFDVFRNSTCFNKTFYAHAQNHWLPKRSPITFVNNYIALTVTRR